jgi:ribosome maturation factor RimP
MGQERGHAGSRPERPSGGRSRSARERVAVVGPPRSGAAEAAAIRTRVCELIEPVVTAVGYELEDVKISRAGRRHLVRITIDGESGVHLDAVAVVSRAVSNALDEADERGGEVIMGEYELEVSSPGVDRPLTLARHWRRNVRRLVKVKLGERMVAARVVEALDAAVVLDVDGVRHEVPYHALGPARVQVEFKRLDEVDDDELESFGSDGDEEGQDET